MPECSPCLSQLDVEYFASWIHFESPPSIYITRALLHSIRWRLDFNLLQVESPLQLLLAQQIMGVGFHICYVNVKASSRTSMIIYVTAVLILSSVQFSLPPPRICSALGAVGKCILHWSVRRGRSWLEFESPLGYLSSHCAYLIETILLPPDGNFLFILGGGGCWGNWGSVSGGRPTPSVFHTK